jgi:uncharacterized protein YbjT (DUF2867 family)
MNTKEKTTLILGGTGKTGSRVAKRLAARGESVRIASRSGKTPFDWDDRATWQEAVRGAKAMYIAYHPDLAAPGAAENIRALSKLAVESGVERMVLLSGRGEPQVLPSEDAVRESEAEFTILRASWFFQNFSEGYLLEPVLSGEVAFPAGNVAEPFIDVDDIAEVAVAALTSDSHVGKTYDLTGPRLLTFADAVGEIAAATGRPIRYVPVSPETYGTAISEFVPAEYVAFLTDLFSHLLDGHNAHTTEGISRILGRPPRDFRDYARTTASSGIWTR